MAKLFVACVGMAGYILTLGTAESIKRAVVAEETRPNTTVSIYVPDSDGLPIRHFHGLPVGEAERPRNVRYRFCPVWNDQPRKRSGKKDSKPYLRNIEACYKKRLGRYDFAAHS